jgi:hypothetical protein
VRFDAGNRLRDRELTLPHAFGGGRLVASEAGDTLWTARLHVEAAWRLRLRLRLDEAAVAAGAEVWVRGDGGPWEGPWDGDRRGPHRVLWTPSVPGPEVEVMVVLPPEMPDAEFTLDAVGELLAAASGVPTPRAAGSCRLDLRCPESSDWPWATAAAASVARINFVRRGEIISCSGGLVADADPRSHRPYLLTANHCLSTAEAAASVEAWWDYRAPDCGGPPPDPEVIPRSFGAELLATGRGGDFTLLRLDAVPPGRWQMGWDRDPAAVAEGTRLYRISHPSGAAQSYSASQVGDAPYSCPAWPDESSIYQRGLAGLVEGGSSGAPVFSASGRVVGQLAGLCGLSSNDPCAFANSVVDGAFHHYWPRVEPWLGGRCVYRVLKPAPGERWLAGEDVELRWSRHGSTCGKEVKLRLWRGAESVPLLPRRVPNDGELALTLPQNLPHGTDYRLEIVDGEDGRFSAMSEGAFSIAAGAGVCRYTLLQPNGGERWGAGERRQILWSQEGEACADAAKLRLLRAGVPAAAIATVEAGAGRHAWSVPRLLPPGDDYVVEILDGGRGGAGDRSDGAFLIDGAAD